MATEQIQHPKSSPITFDIQFQRPWSIVRPRVYRFLESKWIDAFFEDGSLRLSSFRQFARHKDEQRNDPTEGSGTRAGVGSNMTVFIVGGRGSDAYVLCGTVSNIAAVGSAFPQYDGCFVIDDTLQFANSVSHAISHFKGGCEGFVIYEDQPSITKDIGNQTAEELFSKYQNPDGTLDMQMLFDTHARVGGIEEFFLKRAQYAGQAEYRLVWTAGGEVADYLDIKVPEARQYCRRIR